VKEAGFGATVVPTATLTLAVRNLSCDGCAERARATLMATKGAKNAKVEAAAGKAVETYDTRHATPATLIRALNTAGFPATQGS
jgi:copper chaperone CopZ